MEKGRRNSAVISGFLLGAALLVVLPLVLPALLGIGKFCLPVLGVSLFVGCGIAWVVRSRDRRGGVVGMIFGVLLFMLFTLPATSMVVRRWKRDFLAKCQEVQNVKSDERRRHLIQEMYDYRYRMWGHGLVCNSVEKNLR